MNLLLILHPKAYMREVSSNLWVLKNQYLCHGVLIMALEITLETSNCLGLCAFLLEHLALARIYYSYSFGSAFA